MTKIYKLVLSVVLVVLAVAGQANAQITFRVYSGYQPLSTEYDQVSVELSYFHEDGNYPERGGYERALVNTWGCSSPYGRADTGGFVYLLVVCDNYNGRDNLYELLPAGRYNLRVQAPGYQTVRRIIEYDGSYTDLGNIQLTTSPVLMRTPMPDVIPSVPSSGGMFQATATLANNTNNGESIVVRIHAMVGAQASNAPYNFYVLEQQTMALEAFSPVEYATPMVHVPANLPDGDLVCVILTVTDVAKPSLVWAQSSTCRTKGTPRPFQVLTAPPPVPQDTGCVSSPTFVQLVPNCG